MQNNRRTRLTIAIAANIFLFIVFMPTAGMSFAWGASRYSAGSATARSVVAWRSTSGARITPLRSTHRRRPGSLPNRTRGLE